MLTIKEYRQTLKTDVIEDWDNIEKDQAKKIPAPPFEKPYAEDAILVDLAKVEDLSCGKVNLIDVINQRRSRRRFTSDPLTLEELSYLLWTTQGVREIVSAYGRTGHATMRTVPSAGARHAFETYLFINLVDTLNSGLYRYLPLEHKLCLLYEDDYLQERVISACYNTKFAGRCAVCFIWSVIPYRMEWRYGVFSQKVISLDAGHVCQNLYLAAESIGGGTCAIGAYHQKRMDRIIGVDGEEEFTIYVAPVGKLRQSDSKPD